MINICTVVGKAERFEKPWYYLDDGVYCSYSGQIFDHVIYPKFTPYVDGPKQESVLAGPTCDSIDIIAENIELPELDLGDIVVGKMMGAYTISTATEFNFINKTDILVIDTEMQTRLYFERLLAHLSNVDIERIKSGRYNEDEKQRIENSKAWLKKQKFKHIYKPDITDNELYTICKLWINKMGIKFFVFDYLKSNVSETGTNYNVLGAKCDFLKNKIAGELKLSVLAACQLNRQGEVADSDKINRYLSVGIKYGHKTQEQMMRDGIECGNVYAKIYVNRLGKQMRDDDDDDYIDLYFDGDKMTISETKQHNRQNIY